MFRSRRVISMLLVGLYLAWLVAVTWYVWPRSGPEPTPGSLVVEHHRELVVTAAWAMLGLQLLTVLVTVLLLIGAVLGGLPAALLLLGTLTHVTALQRLLYTRDRLAGRTHKAPEGKLRWFGWWLLHRLMFWGYPRATLPYDIAVAVVVVFALCFPLSG